jgi:AraC-like DNA-binding protein
LFYVYYAIRFLNYTFVFKILQDVIIETPEAVAEADTEAKAAAAAVGATAAVTAATAAKAVSAAAGAKAGKSYGLPDGFDKKSVAAMKRRIDKWVAEKRYCQAGVTIKDLADHLGTNTKYISLYINDYEGKSFRNWIGSLRIAEALRLMRENPSWTIDVVAEAIGYANKSAFLLQFAKQTDMKPSEWKENNTI